MTRAALIFLTACAATSKPPTTCPPGRDERFRETTQAQLSQLLVGIADIFDRASPSGGMRPSGLLALFDPDTKREWHDTVFENDVVAIGSDRYCVASIEEGHDSPGWLTLRKLDAK